MARANSRKFGMAVGKALDVIGVLVFAASHLQIGMALGTRCVRNGGQAERISVIHVAIGALRRERLPRLMHRTVVTRQTRLVGYLRSPDRGLEMAGLAVVGYDFVAVREWSCVKSLLAGKQAPADPDQTDCRERNRKHTTPVRNGERCFEIVPVYALRELFRGSNASGHGLS